MVGAVHYRLHPVTVVVNGGEKKGPPLTSGRTRGWLGVPVDETQRRALRGGRGARRCGS